jgi:hypothetical protein
MQYGGEYCDVLPESRNIGTSIYDCSLDSELAKHFPHNEPSDCATVEDRFYTTETSTHLYNSRGMLLLHNGFCWKRFRHNENLRVTS